MEIQNDNITLTLIRRLMKDLTCDETKTLYDILEQKIKDDKKKYRITKGDETKEFKTLQECANYVGVSHSCLYRILDGSNKYKKESSKKLMNIKIEKIKSNDII